MRAVRFHEFGGTDVLKVEDVPQPKPGPGQVLVRVVNAAINPLDSALRIGQPIANHLMPTTFPSGQGFELSGVVAEIGDGTNGFAVGDAVFGYAPRRAQADFVVVEAAELAPKPAALSWAVAASLPTASATAHSALAAVEPKPGETVVVSAAAGGMGVMITQLAVASGARVIATSSPANFDFLSGLGASPVSYGEGLTDRVRSLAPNGVDAYLDNFGDGNVATAIKLGVAPERINTIADFEAAAQYGTKTAGQALGNDPQVWSDFATRVADGHLMIPVANEYDVEQVRLAYDGLDARHTRGKIVLSFGTATS